MVRGLPDDANVLNYGDMQRSDDITELAARLGSPLTYERRGNVLYVDDFSQGAGPWAVTRGLTPETPTLTGDYHLTGGAAWKLANTPGVGETLFGVRHLPLFSEGIYGVFFLVGVTATGNKIQLQAIHYDGVNRWNYVITLYPTQKKLYYAPTSGVETLLSDTMDVFNGVEVYHAVGILFDTDANQWVQVKVDNNVYDLSGIGAEATADSTPPKLRLAVLVVSTSSLDTTILVDSVALVQNPTVLN